MTSTKCCDTHRIDVNGGGFGVAPLESLKRPSPDVDIDRLWLLIHIYSWWKPNAAITRVIPNMHIHSRVVDIHNSRENGTEDDAESRPLLPNMS